MQAAQFCQFNGLYNACANRAYYAMFQSAIAILITKGFEFDEKKHSDHAKVQSMFANELINRRKIFQRKFKTYLYDAQTLRGVADYKMILISQKQAERQLAKAKEFLGIIKEEINND